MASGIAPPNEPVTSSGVLYRPAEQEAYISGRLDETRRHVRAVDLTVAVLKLAIGVLAYLLIVAVLDHWVVSEGLGRGGRIVLWAILVLAGGFYVARWVLPPLLHRINPIFAAYTIEQTRPTFKNGLINFLLLRRQREEIERSELARRVYQGLQLRTAVELAQVTTGTTVDRLHVIRLGYILASLVTVCCLYLVLSPKNPLVSFGRVILPWARIGAPTRVAIDAVAPGDCAAYQGDPVMVSAEVHGLRPNEEVKLFYSSTDDQLVDQSVPMSVPQGGFRYQGELPPGSLGLQQSLLYRIAAGDGTSPTFRIDMQIPPTIVVDRVEYDYPEYTGLERRVEVQKGDLLANEGTRVTIHATANYPIAQAYIEAEGDEQRSIRMSANGTAASGRLTLAMNPRDLTQPEYRGYQLRFTDPERRQNPRPIRHRIDVIPDLSPKIHFDPPPPEELELPVSGSVQLKVHAEDPDFGLRRVAIRAEREGRGLLIPLLLDKPRPSKPHKGPFEASYRFEPARLGLKPGDKVVYWGEAADCKEKEEDKGASANVAETERRTIVIVAADQQQPPAKQPPQEGTAKKRQPGAPEAAPSDKPGEGSADKSDAQPDGQKDQPQKPSGQDQGKKGGQPKGPQSKDKDSASQDKSEDKQPGDQESGNSGSSGGEARSSQPQKSDGKGEKSGAKQPQTKKGEPGESSDATDQGQPNVQDGNQEQSGKSAGKSGQSGGKGEKPSGKVDGQTDPGEAIRRILDHQEEQGGEPSPSDGKTESKPGQKQSGQNPQGGQSPDKQPTPGGENAEGEKKPDDASQNAGKPKGAAGKKSDAKGPDAKADATKGADAKGAESKGSDTKTQSGQKPGAEQTKSGQPAGSEDRQPADAQKGEGQQKAAAGEPMKAGEKSPTAAEEGKTGSEEKPGEPSAPGEKKGEQGNGDNRKTQDGSKSDAQETGKTAPESKPAGQDAKTAQSMPGAEEKKGEGTAKQEKGPKAGEAQPHQEPGGAGKAADEKSASPSPQDANHPHGQEQGDARAKKSESDQTPQSPGISPKTSKSKGETDGDKSGGGKSAGGQKTPQPGAGTPGSQSAAGEGGQKSAEQGPGDAGTKAGEQMKTDQPTGKESPEGEGGGASGQKQAGGSPSGKEPKKGDSSKQDTDSGKFGQPPAEQSAGQKPGQEAGSNAGNPTQGGSAGKDGPGLAAAPPPPPAPDDPNLEYSKKQTTLALEHLADQIAKEKSDLLPQLGWDKNYAENFLRQWEEMRKAAAQPGPQGDAAKRELDKALKSLGLRPTKSKVRAGQGSPDSLQRLQAPGRFEPPSDWKDKFRAYNQGVGGSRD